MRNFRAPWTADDSGGISVRILTKSRENHSLTYNISLLSNEAQGEEDDDELFFHPHWLQYADVIDNVSDAFLYGIGTYITIVCVTGVIGNLSVIVAFSR